MSGRDSTQTPRDLLTDDQGRLITDPNLTTGFGAVDANTLRVTLTNGPDAINVFQPYVAVGSGVTQPSGGQPFAQRVTISDDSVLMYSLGRWDDAPATTDAGSFTLMQFVKRALQNWTTYLSRVPALGSALVSACTPVVAPKKLTVNGFAPVALSTTYTNLLDSAAGTAALDVTDYQSGDLCIVSTATTGSYTIQAALNSAFTSGVHTLQAQEKTVQTTLPLNAAVTPTAATRVFQLNLQGVNFLRVNLTTGLTAGTIQAFCVLNQAPYVPFQNSLPSGQTLAGITGAGTPAVPATPYFVNSAATTNGALILTGTSGLQAFWATNTGAAAAFVKLYNKATAPTVGTDVPEMIIPVPAAVGGVPGVAEITPGFNGHRFPLGLGIAITGGVADSDTTAVAVGQVKVKLSRTV